MVNEQHTQQEYELLRKRGWRYLWRGLIFLGVCLIISFAASESDFVLHNLISESVIVAGWVAMWRPVEIFLYELPELRAEINPK